MTFTSEPYKACYEFQSIYNLLIEKGINHLKCLEYLTDNPTFTYQELLDAYLSDTGQKYKIDIVDSSRQMLSQNFIKNN